MYKFCTICLNICQWKFGLFPTFAMMKLLNMFTHRSLCGHMLSLLLNKLLRVRLLNHIRGKSYIYKKGPVFQIVCTILYSFLIFLKTVFNLSRPKKKKSPIPCPSHFTSGNYQSVFYTCEFGFCFVLSRFHIKEISYNFFWSDLFYLA